VHRAWRVFRRAKPLWYHQVEKNHSPHRGQRKVLQRIPAAAKKSIQPMANTNTGMSLWKSLWVNKPNAKVIGTYPKNAKRARFLRLFNSRQRTSYSSMPLKIAYLPGFAVYQDGRNLTRFGSSARLVVIGQLADLACSIWIFSALVEQPKTY
jgi:hypothetical protein